jgi:RNA polymerase sigma factor (sigma-70 family)
MEHPDQKYITAFLNNDSALIREFYARFSGKIKLMVLKDNGSEEDAKDIFQDAILSITKQARTEKFILTCPMDAFIYVLCRNKWISLLEKRGRRKTTSTDTDKMSNIGDDMRAVLETLNTKEARMELLQKKLAELSDSCKKLLNLSWSGKSMQEVAIIMGIEYGFARKKKCKCIEKLILLVKNDPGFDALKW